VVDSKKKIIDEEITMEVIKDIAESIDNIESFTQEILDLEASVKKEKQNKVEFEFYEKPAKDGVLNPGSAHA
jgi:hypothetical protein